MDCSGEKAHQYVLQFWLWRYLMEKSHVYGGIYPVVSYDPRTCNTFIGLHEAIVGNEDHCELQTSDTDWGGKLTILL